MEYLLYPPITFAIFLSVVFIIYRLVKALGQKSRPEAGKLKAYACGEDIPGSKVQLGYNFFHIAFFFTVLHFVALIIATIPGGNLALFGILYLVVVLITIIIFLRDA